MRQIQEYKDYRSPRHKLLRIFETGRDRWREKCKAAKTALKASRLRIKRLELQRDQLRARTDELFAEVAELRSQGGPSVTSDR